MKQKSQTITAADIAARHVRYINSDTDAEYARLANRIYDSMSLSMRTFGEEVITNVAIGMALYFEDIQSDTHQFEVFAKIYKEWFGLYVPFHASEDETSPTAELDAVNFVLWHAIVAEREGKIVNPLNDGIRDVAKDILNIWHEERDYLPDNHDLIHYTFCDQVLDNPVNIRDNLAWIEGKSFFGRWITNINRMKEDEHCVKEYFCTASKEEQMYEIECLDAFAHRAWPLSLPASYIYAEMIRTEMQDPNDSRAADIEKMESAPLTIYSVVSVGKSGYILKDFKGETYNVKCTEKETLEIAKKGYYIVCGLYRFRGNWYPNGLDLWTPVKKEAYLEYIQKQKAEYDLFHNCSNGMEGAVKKNGGEPIFFFKDGKEHKDFITRELGHLKIEGDLDKVKSKTHLTAFVERNGQMTISQTAEIIKHPRNPYYSTKAAKEDPLSLFQRDSMSPGLAMYLVEHDLLPDMALSDMKGEEHGRLLLHENIDFLVRCQRRDIETDKIFHKRNKDLFASDVDPRNSFFENNMSLTTFIHKVNQLDYFDSNSRKNWQMLACNISLTILMDITRREMYSMQTKSLYEAYLALGNRRAKTADLVPFVGKKNAPAACALLNNIDEDEMDLEQLNKLILQFLKRK